MKILANKFGEILVSRPSGKEAFLALQPMLKGIGKGEKIDVDFAGVSVLTPSWADEFVTPLRGQFQGHVRLMNTENPSVKATLEALEKAAGRQTF